MSLEQIGYAVGFLLNLFFISCGLLFCFCFNCCGRGRAVQRVFNFQRRAQPPLIDFVRNRGILCCLNPLLFIWRKLPSLEPGCQSVLFATESLDSKELGLLCTNAHVYSDCCAVSIHIGDGADIWRLAHGLTRSVDDQAERTGRD